MTKLLVKSEFDYADEFDVYGMFIVKDQKELDEIADRVQAQVDDEGGCWESYFGTNEMITISSKEDWLRGLTVVEITEDEAKFLKEKVFGEYYDDYGHTVMPE